MSNQKNNMTSYRTEFLVLTLFISALSVFMIAMGFVLESFYQIIFWIAVLAIWWGLWWYLRTHSRLSHWLSLAAVNVVWWLLFLNFGCRINFVYVHRALDTPEEGSPMAFVMGFAVELLFFVPATLALITGLLAFRGLKSDR